MWSGIGNSPRILLTAEESCMFMRLNCVYTIGATPTKQPCLKGFRLNKLAGVALYIVNYHGHVECSCISVNVA